VVREVEEVAHPSLVDGSEIIIHSHAGGRGADVKSGIQTGIIDNGWRPVTFNTAFSSIPHVVAVFANMVGKDDILEVGEASTTGFKIWVSKAHGGSGDYHDVFWIATNAGNA